MMTERDYEAWLGAAYLWRGHVAHRSTDPEALRDYILSDKFTIAAFKGQGLSFRHWDLQLRQPILLAGPRALFSIAPSKVSCIRVSTRTRLATTNRRQNAMRVNKYARLAHSFAIASGALMLAASPCFAATLFVTSERDNTVTVLDSNTLAVKKVIMSGRGRGVSPSRPIIAKSSSVSAMTTGWTLSTRRRCQCRAAFRMFLIPNLSRSTPLGARLRRE